MKKLSFYTLVFSLISGGLFAQVKVVQEKELQLQKSDSGDYYEVSITPAPFTLQFEGRELMVSAGLSEDLFASTKPDIDINVDFGSYFYIGKFLAMEEDASYLPTGAHEAASLNKNHGAKSEAGGRSSFEVRFLDVAGDKKPLSDFKEFYMAVWLDQNKDQFIDSDEIIHLKVNIQ